jgi:hypothetical protein
VWDFWWGMIAHEAITRRPPIPLYTTVPLTGDYAYNVGVWDLSIVQGPFSVAPCPTLTFRFRNFCVAVGGRPERGRRRRGGGGAAGGGGAVPHVGHHALPRHGAALRQPRRGGRAEKRAAALHGAACAQGALVPQEEPY